MKRVCPECTEPLLRKINHFSKEFRCGKCRSEFVLTGVSKFIRAFTVDFMLWFGVILGLITNSWLIGIFCSLVLPILGYTYTTKYSKLKLVGLRAKIKEKGL